MRLGRKPHDPAAVAHAPSLASHRMAAFVPPPVLDRSHVKFQPGLYGNDVLPDCTAAGVANAASAVAAINGYGLSIDAALVPIFYAQSVECAPTEAAMAATDGAVMLDVLKLQAQQGVDIGPQRLVGLFGTLPLNRVSIANAMTRLGHAYLGVTLHERDMEMGAMWDVQDGRDDGAVIGGHCIVGFDYLGLADDTTLRVATWGRLQPATWAWLQARVDEAYALFWRQLATAGGVNLGVDPDVLAADLTAMVGTEAA